MNILYFAVTNELSYDQRMQRVCRTLAQHGYEVHLVGRHRPGAPPLQEEAYRQHRLPCFFQRGKAFYIEYQLRLLAFLLFRRISLVCAVDLDTIIPCYLVSRIRGCQRVYDAHEWFPEMKEVVTRPAVRAVWTAIERFLVPRFPQGYTVSEGLVARFRETYGVDYALIRNLPERREAPAQPAISRHILYQGDLNEGRCFETLIPAMRAVRGELHIYGEGNFSARARELARAHQLDGKVFFHGRVLPRELAAITPGYRVGITLFDPVSGSNRHSLANRFFDYIQAGVPQLCSDFPEYRQINARYEVSLLTDPTDPDAIALALNNLLENEVLYSKLRKNCMEAARTFTWNAEADRLVAFYRRLTA